MPSPRTSNSAITIRVERICRFCVACVRNAALKSSNQIRLACASLVFATLAIGIGTTWVVARHASSRASISENHRIPSVLTIASGSADLSAEPAEPCIIGESIPETIGSIPKGWMVAIASQQPQDLTSISLEQRAMSIRIPMYELLPNVQSGSSSLTAHEPTAIEDQRRISLAQTLQRQMKSLHKSQQSLSAIVQQLSAMEKLQAERRW